MGLKIIMSILSFTLYAIKGGQHVPAPLSNFAHNLHGFHGKAIRWLLDGHNISAVAFGFIYMSPLAAIMWYIGCRPSIGEMVGGIGGYKGNWCRDNKTGTIEQYPQDQAKTARISAAKLAVQRGTFMGACLTLGTGFIPFIPICATFPLAIYAGISIAQFWHKQTIVSFRCYEWVYGIIIGLGVYGSMA